MSGTTLSLDYNGSRKKKLQYDVDGVVDTDGKKLQFPYGICGSRDLITLTLADHTIIRGVDGGANNIMLTMTSATAPPSFCTFSDTSDPYSSITSLVLDEGYYDFWFKLTLDTNQNEAGIIALGFSTATHATTPSTVVASALQHHQNYMRGTGTTDTRLLNGVLINNSRRYLSSTTNTIYPYCYHIASDDGLVAGTPPVGDFTIEIRKVA